MNIDSESGGLLYMPGSLYTCDKLRVQTFKVEFLTPLVHWSCIYLICSPCTDICPLLSSITGQKLYYRISSSEPKKG